MKRILLALAILLLFVSCQNFNSSTANYDSVVFIGIDSAGSFLESSEINGFSDIFATNSAVNYHCTCVSPSASAQNWGSFLHGVSPETHKCVNGSIACERFPYAKYPSVFKIIRQVFSDSKLASFCEWNAINYGLIEPSAKVNKSSDVRFCASVHNTDEIMEMTLDYLENNTAKLLFVHLDNVDYAGHMSGYETEKYYEALQKDVDFVQQVDALIDHNKTLLIVAADHGGIDKDHGGKTDKEMDITIAIKGKTITQSELKKCCPMDVSVVILKALGIEKPSFMEGEVPEGLTL